MKRSFHQRFSVTCYSLTSIKNRDAGTAVRRAEGAVQELRAMQTYKKQTNSYRFCLFLVSKVAALKNNTKNYLNLYEVSGCANSCNKFVSSISG